MRPLAPTYTAHLLVPIHEQLVTLLHSLTPAQWLQPTSAGRWRVREIVAHLLDGDLRRLSYCRDGLAQPEMATLRSYDDVLAYLNRLNETWIAAAGRLSPRLLTQLVEVFGRQAVEYLAELPPHETACWAVSWAGEGRSEHWMDVGRNYTEYWHHQQQIREAVGAPLLTGPAWLRPALELGVRAVPAALRNAGAVPGTTVHLHLSGPAGGDWWLRQREGGWRLSDEAPSERPPAITTIELDAENAARTWFAARRPQPAAEQARISGDPRLAGAVLAARALMV